MLAMMTNSVSESIFSAPTEISAPLDCFTATALPALHANMRTERHEECN